MPTSQPNNLSPICEWLISIPKPSRALDVGVGMGKWGVLLREYFDCWGMSNVSERHTEIHGIEVCEKYMTKLHNAVYDEMFIGEAEEILSGMSFQSYGVVLLIDVLEHFEKEAGQRVLSECARVGERVMVSIPCPGGPQGAWGGNEYERHRSDWSEAEFAEWGETWLIPPTDHSARLLLIEGHEGRSGD